MPDQVLNLIHTIGHIETPEDEELAETHLMDLDLVNLVIIIKSLPFIIDSEPFLLDGHHPVFILVALEI